MKKGLIAGAVALAFAPVSCASAIELNAGAGSEARDVTVGETDETIYSVDLTWGDMVFDWKYDDETNSYKFRQQRGISEAVSVVGDGENWLNSEKAKGYIFEDESCRNLFTGELDDDTIYYHCPIYRASGVVQLSDNSTNGKVKASASFTAANSYDWVTGRFGLWEMDLHDDLIFNESANGEFRQYVDVNWDGSYTAYKMINLDLEKNRALTSSDSITTDDTIGTITISIEPDMN